MFQFTRFPPHALCVQAWVAKHYQGGVSPFGYLRIYASVQLPGAFRRLRVLHRRLVPRHSPRTLFSFDKRSHLQVLDACTYTDSTICDFQRARRWPPTRAGPCASGKRRLYPARAPVSSQPPEFSAFSPRGFRGGSERRHSARNHPVLTPAQGGALPPRANRGGAT